MERYTAGAIKNIAITGHSNSGKTSLTEALLFLSGSIDRLGKPEEGNTASDFDAEEIKRKISINSTVYPIELKGKKINILDTPGLFDFAGGLEEGIRGAGSVIINISAKSGVSVGTVKAFELATNVRGSKMFFVNKMNSESADFYKVFEQLKTQFGAAVCPIVVPFVVDRKVQCYVNILENKAYTYTDGKPTETSIPDMGSRLEGLRTAIYEAIAETDDELFEKYFSGEEFTPEEMITGVATGIREGSIFPVFCGSAQTTEGVDQLLKGINWLAPTASSKTKEVATDEDGNEVQLTADENAKTVAIVFKTVSDPFVGKMSFVKVASGKITADSSLLNSTKGEIEKVGKLLYVKGKKQEDTKEIVAGDIGAIVKLNITQTGDTLCSTDCNLKLKPVNYTKPSLSMAILPQNKGDEDKIAQALIKLMEEDKTLKFENNIETHQMIISGLGEQHLDTVISKLKNKFTVDALLERPKVAYRETIRAKVSARGKHKKQTGGHGQFGDVVIEFEPCDCEGLEFYEKVVGGSVPKGYFPAVEKGLLETIQKGTLAGYPVVGLKATLVDGSYHPVDSSEMAFKMAAIAAFKAAIPTANPVLLEPIASVTAVIPNDTMGDVIGEITKRRGRVLGMEPIDNGYQKLIAEAAMAEMFDFTTYIRQVTRGSGSIEYAFERYEDAPYDIVNKVIEDSKAKGLLD